MGNKCIVEAYSFDKERKGFIIEAGIGAGYSILSPGESFIDNYSSFGLAINWGFGYAPSNQSSIIFAVKSNIFTDEVAAVWSDWADKMSGDDIGALGAKLVSPFVFLAAPLIRSHSIFGSLEYTYFTKEQAPSLLFSGSAGLGLLYDKTNKQPFGGLGLSAGAGYEFTRRAAINLDVLYSYVASDLQGISVLLTLNFYLY